VVDGIVNPREYRAVSLTRRSFLQGLAAVPVGAMASLRQRGAAPGPRVNALTLQQRIGQLSLFGRPVDGTFADGVSRVAFSDFDVQGRRYVMGRIQAAGLEPRIDPAGNIFARRAGSTDGPPILFGSHIDSVPNGGNFDGDLGVLASLGVMEALATTRTRHPLEMVIWSSEEGVAYGRGLAGSRIVAGDLQPGDMDAVWNGMRRADAIRKIGGNPERIDQAIRQKGAHHCYLELHIEQGGTLEKAAIPVGVVEGIVAIHRYTAVVTGFANHAGTTPMAERQDALVAASKLTIAVNEVVTREPGRQVGTVGHMEITPNAPNVIPGEAQLVIELRDLSADKLLKLIDEVRKRAAAIATETKTTIVIKELSKNPPALATPDVQGAIERASGTLQLDTRRLPSGAGHDAQMMAQLSPMGMIFVPSVGGISHSPKELTHWQDCANGADVLLRAVLEMDKL
jgi:beta-ureidopropionase / N-carbamoyl-L-amino-acid hydrolase